MFKKGSILLFLVATVCFAKPDRPNIVWLVSDTGRLVRVRAAEFLGLIRADDPRPVIMEVLSQVEDPVEANLILNSAALIEGLKLGYDFDVSQFRAASWAKDPQELTNRRLDYLSK